MPRLDYETPTEPEGSNEIAPILRFTFGVALPLTLLVPVVAMGRYPWDVLASLFASLLLLIVLSCYAFRNVFLRRQRRLPYIEERNAYLTIVCGAMTPFFWLVQPIAVLFFMPRLPQRVPNIPLL